MRQDEADRGGRTDLPTSSELRGLRRENAELRRTTEILKLATSFSPRRPTLPGAGPDGR